jgi:transposase
MDSSMDISALHALIRDLLARVSVLEAENAVLRAENTALRAENLALKARLGQDSSNSDKPPSSDGYAKKPAPAFNRKTGKKVGGQLGHEGHSLELVAVPDLSHIYHAPFCVHCGGTFSVGDSHYKGIQERRQVWDMPIPKLEVTEHCIGVHVCCGMEHVGRFPSAVTSRIQYGVNVATLSSLLTTEYRLSFEKASQLLGDVYGCPVNVSTIATFNADLYEDLAPVEETIVSEILKSDRVHFDETGMRVEGKLHWFHVACTNLFCYFYVHAKRGKEAIQSTSSLLPRFFGWAIHDCWASYFNIDNCKHALCGAHLLRELKALTDNGSHWAKEMHYFLMECYEYSLKGTETVPDPKLWLLQYKNICEKADKEEPAPVAQKRGKPKNTKGRNLLNRLVAHQDGVMAFALHKEVPFTNNCAEQAIRHLKIKQKISMSFRTLQGAKIYARIQGAINTIKNHKMNLFQTIKDIKLKKNIIFTPTK